MEENDDGFGFLELWIDLLPVSLEFDSFLFLFTIELDEVLFRVRDLDP